MSSNDFSQFSLLDLFHQEAENQTAALTQGLLALEIDPTEASRLEALMRAAHSLKGAARIVGIAAAVRVAHAMEDCFVAAQRGQIVLNAEAVDVLLKSVDLFNRIAQTPEGKLEIWKTEHTGEVEQAVQSVNAIATGTLPSPAASSEPAPAEPAPEYRELSVEPPAEAPESAPRPAPRNRNRPPHPREPQRAMTAFCGLPPPT